MSLIYVPRAERADSPALKVMGDASKTPEAVQLQHVLNQSKWDIVDAFVSKVSQSELLSPTSWEGMLLLSVYRSGSQPDIIQHLLDHFGERNVAVIKLVGKSLGRGPSHFTYDDSEVEEISYLGKDIGGFLCYTAGGYFSFINTTETAHYQSGLNLDGRTSMTCLFTRVYQALRDNLSSKFLRRIVSLVDLYPELHHGHVGAPADGVITFNINRRKLPALYSVAEFVFLPGIKTRVYVDTNHGTTFSGCTVHLSLLQEYIESCANP